MRVNVSPRCTDMQVGETVGKFIFFQSPVWTGCGPVRLISTSREKIFMLELSCRAHLDGRLVSGGRRAYFA